MVSQHVSEDPGESAYNFSRENWRLPGRFDIVENFTFVFFNQGSSWSLNKN